MKPIITKTIKKRAGRGVGPRSLEALIALQSRGGDVGKLELGISRNLAGRLRNRGLIAVESSRLIGGGWRVRLTAKGLAQLTAPEH